MNLKSTKEEKLTEGELRHFMELLKNDKDINEVNFEKNEIEYRVNGYLVTIKFSAKAG